MHTPLINPTVVRIVPMATAKGEPCVFVEISACLTVGSTDETVFDLFVKDDADTVVASISRGRAGALLAFVAPSDGVNPLTGRPWFVGQIGPASELTPPPPLGLLPVPEDGEACLFAPVVKSVCGAREVSTYFEEYPDATCIDLCAGNNGDLVHVVVPMKSWQVQNSIRDARIIGKSIVVWYGPAMPIYHPKTGRLVHIGHITRTGDHPADA
ncbi:hypothetical protein [Agrobacterium salinitolerans]|uniref:hypothetical protein n=1 Tax=Agrobacterium salinitolerans TaxID=1183413 RepID=UPI0022B813C7|nr:hypothetical protein [Agrobacterium salinitolerans]MCZ7857076.1 hypothetical protein [Agrobacterium salinitolerans]MCZ7885843.1 hypothetical protein [Agrobacterium salinitolerans]